MSSPASFRQRVIAREPLIGSFLKTPTSHATEIIGDAGFDFVVIDQEHAPFGRTTTDIALPQRFQNALRSSMLSCSSRL